MNDYAGLERRSHPPLSRGEIEAIAKCAARAVLHDYSAMLGVDSRSQDAINEFRADLVDARKTRKMKERGGLIALSVLVASAVGGAAGILWQAMKGGAP